MKLYIVFAQRREVRRGEYAPEPLFVVSEYDYDENPDWIKERLAEVKADGEYAAADIFLVDLGNDARETIRAHLLDYPGLTGAIAVEAA